MAHSPRASTKEIPALCIRSTRLIEEAFARALQRYADAATEIHKEHRALADELLELIRTSTDLSTLQQYASLLPARRLHKLQRAADAARAIAIVHGWVVGKNGMLLSQLVGDVVAPLDTLPVEQRRNVPTILGASNDVRLYRDTLIEQAQERQQELDAIGTNVREIERDETYITLRNSCAVASVVATALMWLVGQEREAYERLLSETL